MVSPRRGIELLPQRSGNHRTRSPGRGQYQRTGRGGRFCEALYPRSPGVRSGGCDRRLRRSRERPRARALRSSRGAAGGPECARRADRPRRALRSSLVESCALRRECRSDTAPSVRSESTARAHMCSRRDRRKKLDPRAVVTRGRACSRLAWTLKSLRARARRANPEGALPGSQTAAARPRSRSDMKHNGVVTRILKTSSATSAGTAGGASKARPATPAATPGPLASDGAAGRASAPCARTPWPTMGLQLAGARQPPPMPRPSRPWTTRWTTSSPGWGAIWRRRRSRLRCSPRTWEQAIAAILARGVSRLGHPRRADTPGGRARAANQDGARPWTRPFACRWPPRPRAIASRCAPRGTTRTASPAARPWRPRGLRPPRRSAQRGDGAPAPQPASAAPGEAPVAAGVADAPAGAAAGRPGREAARGARARARQAPAGPARDGTAPPEPVVEVEIDAPAETRREPGARATAGLARRTTNARVKPPPPWSTGRTRRLSSRCLRAIRRSPRPAARGRTNTRRPIPRGFQGQGLVLYHAAREGEILPNRQALHGPPPLPRRRSPRRGSPGPGSGALEHASPGAEPGHRVGAATCLEYGGGEAAPPRAAPGRGARWPCRRRGDQHGAHLAAREGRSGGADGRPRRSPGERGGDDRPAQGPGARRPRGEQRGAGRERGPEARCPGNRRRAGAFDRGPREA